MRIHLLNPSDISFGRGVITPRWLFVLAAATPRHYGDPLIIDETLVQIDFSTIQKGDVIGIGIHTANVLRGYEVGRKARELGAYVVFGGIHATLYPEESFELGGAHAVVKGDGDDVWAQTISEVLAGTTGKTYDGGRVGADRFLEARWDLLPDKGYMFASVQTVRGCPKHCSFCSVWRTDGQKPRQRSTDAVINEIVALRRQGFRFITLSDDNFYTVTLTDISLAERQGNPERINELKTLREERFELMEALSQLPSDMVFFTQITMEAAEDSEFLDAMSRARIKGALVGIEAVTEEGLKAVFKDFNYSGENLIARLKEFKKHNVHVLGSFIFGLHTDRAETFDATAKLALEADITIAQFVMMTPFPGTVDFIKWEKDLGDDVQKIDGIPVTRYWLIPPAKRPKLYTPHPTMKPEEIRMRTQKVWDAFYETSVVWKRAGCVKSLKSKLAFFLISKLYRQMYANTGIATDSARRKSSTNSAKWLTLPLVWIFKAKPMPDLQKPVSTAVRPSFAIMGQ